jgi:hypothetical protein
MASLVYGLIVNDPSKMTDKTPKISRMLSQKHNFASRTACLAKFSYITIWRPLLSVAGATRHRCLATQLTIVMIPSSMQAPIAISIVKLITRLPEEEKQARLPPVLLRICNTLRNRWGNFSVE